MYGAYFISIYFFINFCSYTYIHTCMRNIEIVEFDMLFVLHQLDNCRVGKINCGRRCMGSAYSILHKVMLSIITFALQLHLPQRTKLMPTTIINNEAYYVFKHVALQIDNNNIRNNP